MTFYRFLKIEFYFIKLYTTNKNMELQAFVHESGNQDIQDIVPIEDLSKCLSINDTTITYGLINDQVYVNLTKLCQAGGKQYKDWRRIKSTEEFLEALNLEDNIYDIIQTMGKGKDQGSFGHPLVAINIAYWISPQFQVKVAKWIYELGLYGKVELGKEKSVPEMDSELVKTLQKQLECSKDKNVKMWDNYCKLNEKSIFLEDDVKDLRRDNKMLKLDMTHGLIPKRENKIIYREEMLFCMMKKHLKPIYVRAVPIEDILAKYPKSANPKFKQWYIFNEPCNYHDDDDSESSGDADGEESSSTDYEEELRKLNNPKYKKKILKKKAKLLKKKDDSEDEYDGDDSDYDDESDPEDNYDDDRVVKNTIVPKKHKYSIYKKRYQNTYKQYYTIESKVTRKTKYAAILYARVVDMKYAIANFKSVKKYKTPDPNIFETSIMEIDHELISSYVEDHTPKSEL